MKQKEPATGIAPYMPSTKGKYVFGKNVILITDVSDQQLMFLLEQLCGNKGGIPPRAQMPQ